MDKTVFNIILDEAYRQWTDFKEERKDCTLSDFVSFAKEIAEEKEDEYSATE